MKKRGKQDHSSGNGTNRLMWADRTKGYAFSYHVLQVHEVTLQLCDLCDQDMFTFHQVLTKLESDWICEKNAMTPHGYNIRDEKKCHSWTYYAQKARKELGNIKVESASEAIAPVLL